MADEDRRYGAKAKTERELAPYRDAVNEAAGRSRGLWLGFIAVLAYLYVAVGTVTHRDLLLENPVRLPVLNVDLPLLGFFGVASVFCVINHFFLLLQLMGVSFRIREFNEELARSWLDETERRRLRRSLDSFVIVQLLGGTREEREGVTGFFLKSIALITLVVAPVGLLLLIQLQFLPYQNEPMSWTHRAAVLADVLVLLVFWPSLRQGTWAFFQGSAVRVFGVAGVLFFSIAIATFPGEFADGGSRASNWMQHEDSRMANVKGALFGKLETGEERQGVWFLRRAIDLPSKETLIELTKLDEAIKRQKSNEKKVRSWDTDRTVSLRNRNFRGAMFDATDLRFVDFSESNLHGASFEAADLRGASLAWAKLGRASLVGAKLEGASLKGALLEQTFLKEARLQGANLRWAKFYATLLDQAQIQGAWLDGADLQNTSLVEAALQGASLAKTKIRRTVFERANLQGAIFKGAHVSEESSFAKAKLGGAIFQDAHSRERFTGSS